MYKVIICTLIVISAVVTGYTQDNPANSDRTLRGSGRVNPSTLGMEIDIPLGSYPGRGINVPVSLSYSSKVWRMESLGLTDGGRERCRALSRARYGEQSAAGWTTSLAVPYIEYTGRDFDQWFTTEGFPIDEGLCPAAPPQTNNLAGYIRRLSVHLPSGETHELRADDTATFYDRSSTCPPANGYSCDPNSVWLQENWDRTYYSVDGSNLKYYENSAEGAYRLLMPDGSHYDFNNSLSNLYDLSVRKALTFTDRNGNQTSYNNSTGAWTDTLGRVLYAPITPQVPVAPTSAQNPPQNYTLPGMTGSYKFIWRQLKGATAAESGLANFAQDLKYTGDKISQTTNGGWTSHPAQTYLFHSNFDSYVQSSPNLFNPIVLTEIELPTGQKYKFGYDIYGVITQIDYPTGGRESFTYTAIPALAASYRTEVSEQTNLAVSSRKLYPTAGQTGIFYDWLYSAARVEPAGYKISTTNPDGTKSERFLHQANAACIGCFYGTFGYDNGLAGMAYEERAFAAGGELKSRNLTRWARTSFQDASYGFSADWHPRIESEENFIYEGGSAVSAYTKYEYEGDLNQRETPVQVKRTTQYAFTALPAAARNPGDPGPIEPGENPAPNPTPVPTPVPSALTPVKITETTYLINDPNYLSSQTAYKNARLLNLVTVSEVKNGAGIPVSRSEMIYDESGYSEPLRGNPTTARVWDSTKGLVTNPNAYIQTRAKFDYYGNQKESIDAKGVSTVTAYDGTYHAFPISVTTAAPDPSGVNGSNAGFTTTATFNYTTGLPLTTTDANEQTTTMEYDPVTLRLKKVTPPAGAGTSETFYHDEPNNYWVKSKKQIDMNKYAETTTYYDGLGRAYKTEQLDAQGNIFIEKEFDSDGRIKRVTNPFRTGETKQWTTNVYDEASRVKEVVLADGAKVKTDYGISVVTPVGITKQITDQAGKKRRGITDALGRMIRVIEDPDGQDLATDYTFDTLGNLRKTEQGVQNRYFFYDSLSRLRRARQPEQQVNSALALSVADPLTGNNGWSVKYEYDDNGNIITTTDARGISIVGTYDQLNRLKLRDYSDATPDVSFYYDGSGLGTEIPNYAKGKTTKVTSSISETRYTAFDSLGRLLASEQRTPFATTETIATATPRTSSYQYNLSGAMISETYPSGRTVFNQFDQDGALSFVRGRKSVDYGVRTYASGIVYNTVGAVTKLHLGNGRWESAMYNERQQVTQIGLGTTDADENLLKLEYDYGTITQNNGSLRQQRMTVPTVGANAGFTATQTYTYDDLNRLQSATELINGTNPSWKQTFVYDRYGNRRFDAANTTTLSSGCTTATCNPLINPADNRFADAQGYGYDVAGNVTQDALGKQFFYDAESHQKEVKINNTTIGLYLYDGLGKRVKKISAFETTVFVYDGGGALVAEYSNDLSSQPQTSYLTTDHLGSPRVITDQDGKVTKRQDYGGFGDETLTANRTTGLGYTGAVPPTNNDPRQGYTGYQQDDESGLEFAQARYYNTAHGRFTSVDPLTASASIRNPQTFNRYSYVLNNPYKFSDPLGLLPQTCCRQQDIEDQIRKDFGSGTVNGQPFKLDEKSLKAIVKLLSPFYTAAARAGAKAQQQINNAQAKPPKVTQVVTEVIKPGSTTTTTTTSSIGANLGATTNQSGDTKVKTGTNGVDIEENGQAALEESASGSLGGTSTTVTQTSEPSTKTTTTTVPDDSVSLANDNLVKAQETIANLADSAASAINGTVVTGLYIESANNTMNPNGNTKIDANSFDLESKLETMFNAGRETKKPK